MATKSTGKRLPKVFLTGSDQHLLLTKAVALAEKHPHWYSTEIAREAIKVLEETRRPSLGCARKYCREQGPSYGIIFRERGDKGLTTVVDPKPFSTKPTKELSALPVDGKDEFGVTLSPPVMRGNEPKVEGPSFGTKLRFALKHDPAVRALIQQLVNEQFAELTRG